MSWRRITILAATILAALLASTWFVLQRTGATTGLVRSFLEQLLRTQFRIESASLDPFGGSITIEDIEIRDPMREGANLVAADSVEIAVAADPLGNVLALHEIEVDGLSVDVDFTEGMAPDLSQILKEQRAATGVSAGIGEVTPASIRGGRARIRVDDEVPALDFDEIALSLRRVPSSDGSPDPRRGALLGRARFANLDVAVEIEGEVDLLQKRCRLQARVAGLTVDAAFVRRLLPLLRTQLRDDVASGKLDELLLQLELPLDASAEPIASASFGFSDATCTIPQVPVPLRTAEVRGVVSTKDGGIAQFTGKHVLPTGTTEVTARVTDFFTTPKFDVRGNGRGVQIDDTVRAALRTFPAGDRIVDGLRPSEGSADFDLYLRSPGQEDEIIDLDVQLKGVALAFHGFGPAETRASFPLPVVDAQGRVHMRDDVVSIEDVTARIAPEAGGGDVTISGRVDPSYAGPEQVSLDLDAPRIQFTPALRSAMAALVNDNGALYDQFAPEGTAAVQLRLRPTPGEQSTWQVLVSPLDAKARWAGFPLPLDAVNGTILARSEGLEIDLQASYAGGAATLRGKLMSPLDQPSAISLGSIDLRVDGQGVPLDEQLRVAVTTLAPKLDAVWRELSPSGRANTLLHVRRDRANEEMRYDLELDLQEGHALPTSFPLPVTKAHGQVFVHGVGEEIDVQVDAIRGVLQEQRKEPAQLAVIGTMHTGKAGYTEDLTAVVRGLELDATLGATLERTGAVGTGTWDVLRPSGAVDLVLRQATTNGATSRRYDVLMHGVRSDAELLPMPAVDVVGELQVEDGVLRFSDLRARMGPALVTCSEGYVGPSAEPGRTEVAFRVYAPRFPLDDTFARLFVGPMKKSVLERQFRGALDIDGLRLRFLLPQDGTEQPIETLLQGSIRALDVEMLLGTRLQQVNGNIAIAESRVTVDGGAIEGQFTNGSLTLFGHPFVQASADFSIRPEQFALKKLGFSLHGGRVTARMPDQDSLAYVFGDEKGQRQGRLSADLAFSGLSVRDFLAQCGLANTPYHGTAQGMFRLDRLDGQDFVDMQGSGEFSIVDGNLGTVPLFTAIYALMAEKSRPRFESLAAKFEVRDRKAILSDLALKSPLVSLRGGGELTMEGYVDVAVTTDSFLGGGADMLLLPPMIQMITSNLVRFHLFGHLRDLQAEQRWFAQRDPRRQSLPPVPPRLERTMRPDF